MQSMNISLPDPLKKFVDGQIAQGRYSSVSEYVRELIRADVRVIEPFDVHATLQLAKVQAERCKFLSGLAGQAGLQPDVAAQSVAPKD